MANAAENTTLMYEVFAKSQQQFFEQWAKAVTNLPAGGQAWDPTQKVSQNTREAMQLYDAWKDNAGKCLDILASAWPGTTGTNTFSRVMGAADAFTKLYEVWEPLATAMQKQAVDADSYKSLFDPAKYAETIANIFGFGDTSAFPGLPGDASESFRTWTAKGPQFLQHWADATRANMDTVLAAESGDVGAAMEAFHRLHTAFDRSFGKLLDMPAVGKDREQVELFSRTIDHYALFLAKTAELQHHMQLIAQQAMEEVVRTMAQRVEDGEPIKGFGEFVQLWTKTNEEAFLDFFRTEEYSQLQGIVLDTAVDCRKQFHQLIETLLADFPVALSSELDDVSKKNYALNKSVRALKKKTAEIDEMRAELAQLRKKVTAVEKKLAADKPSGTGPRSAAKTS